MSFEQLKLSPALLSALKTQGYETPTPIQLQAIPIVLAKKDILACAQTGTGKTAAFALPILQLLSEKNDSPIPSDYAAPRIIKALVLAPTRELSSQIHQSFKDYGAGLSLQSSVVFGGVHQHHQAREMKKGVDILVATPGRLLDLMNQRIVKLDKLEILVLDEADRMLDMGFIHDVKRILKGIPKNHQTLFFSATMPPEIKHLSEQMLRNPERIAITPVASTAERISQNLYEIPQKQKTSLLIQLLKDTQIERSIVFTRTKRDANRVCDSLNREGFHADAIHGNKSQGAREKALDKFKKGTSRVLVATDIAARGIDIDQITHVFNHDIPNVSETYVHRIGRTARAGAQGIAISFCAPNELPFLRDIEKLIKKRLQVIATPTDLPFIARPKRMPRPQGSGGKFRSNSKHPLRVKSEKKLGESIKRNPPPSQNNRRARRMAAQMSQKQDLWN